MRSRWSQSPHFCINRSHQRSHWQEVKCVLELQPSRITMTKDGNLLFMSLLPCTLINSEIHPFIFTMCFFQFPQGDQSFILLKMTEYYCALTTKTLFTLVYTLNVLNIRQPLLMLTYTRYFILSKFYVSKLKNPVSALFMSLLVVF